jgi:hypothetical protein
LLEAALEPLEKAQAQAQALLFTTALSQISSLHQHRASKKQPKRNRWLKSEKKLTEESEF